MSPAVVALWVAAVLAAAAAAVVISDLETPHDEPVRAGADAVSKARVKPVAARDFADSVGVNIHLTYRTTPYGDFERVLSSLEDLGVRHVRDGLVVGRPDQEERLNRLADAGIRSTLIMGAPKVDTVADQIAVLERNLRVAEAIEGPNEYDVAGDPNWAPALRRYQRDLYAQVNANPALRDLGVLGPTVARTGNVDVLDGMRDAMDTANIHPYPGGGPPEPALARAHELLTKSTRRSDAVATETGYHNALKAGKGHPGVTEAVAADYLPRLFLSAYADGFRRTYWYELVDVAAGDPGREANFGLLRADFEPKPAFTALKNLMRLVSDSGKAAGARRRLRMSISSSPRPVRRLLLQKADGTYLLALWQELRLSGGARARLDERPARLRVELPQAVARATVYRPSRSSRPVTRLRGVKRIPVALGADAVVVHVARSAP